MEALCCLSLLFCPTHVGPNGDTTVTSYLGMESFM